MGNDRDPPLPSGARSRIARRRRVLASGLLTALVFGLAAGEAQGGAKERAKREFQAGKTAFGAGDFDEALQRYRRAYEIVPLPGLLFNIAQCHRNLGNHRQAINFFRLYLAKVPKAPNRTAVEALLVDLENKARDVPREPQGEPDRPPPPAEDGTQRPPPDGAATDDRPGDQDSAATTMVLPPEDPPRKPPRRRPLYAKWWFWTAVAVAIGGGVAGVYFGTRGSSDLPDSRFPIFDVSVK